MGACIRIIIKSTTNKVPILMKTPWTFGQRLLKRHNAHGTVAMQIGTVHGFENNCVVPVQVNLIVDATFRKSLSHQQFDFGIG
jgi:hypothetical protein